MRATGPTRRQIFGLTAPLLTAAGASAYAQSPAGGAPPKAVDLDAPQVSARQCGAKGDGRADDTDALKLWLRILHENQVRGLLPSGRYRVREGELVWTGGSEHEPGPWIDTAPGATLVAAQVNEAPLLEIRNSTPFKFVTGGYLGPLQFQDRPQPGVVARHGLRLSGLHNMRFGYMRGVHLNGDLIHCEKRDLNGNPDPFQVGLCTFEGVETFRGAGWTFNNNNEQGFGFADIQTLRNILGGKGAFRGVGSGNRIRRVSVGSCAGWAMDLFGEQGTLPRFELGPCEFDDPEYGIRIAGVSLATLTGIRFVHRPHRDGTKVVYHPKIALSLGSDAPRSRTQVYAMKIEMIHRTERGGTKADLGVFFTANKDSNVFDVDVQQTVHDTGALGIADEALYQDIAPISAIRVRNRGRVIYDGYPRADAIAAATPDQVIRNTGYATPASKVMWRTEVYGGPNVPQRGYKAYASASGEYVVPMDGLYRIRAQLCLAGLPAGTRVRAAVMLSRINQNKASNQILAENYGYAATPGPQTYFVACERPLRKGDRIWISADQNSGADRPVYVGAHVSASNVFEVNAANAGS